MTSTQFSSLPIHANSIKALNEVFCYSTMTHVQEATLPVILSGKDVLAKAKTGTGKTLAFLIPAVERLIAKDKLGGLSKGCIGVLVISPTRELAFQITTEASKLLRFHPHYSVGSVVGGTDIKKDQKMLAKGPTILVATPGRLIDHFQNTSGMPALFRSLETFVLDEADRMLDMGFRPDVERILTYLPKPGQHGLQTLMFTATVSPALEPVMRLALKADHRFINTVPEDAEQTHLHVKQVAHECPLEDVFVRTYQIIKEAMKEPNYKVLVFFTTARTTQFAADLFSIKLGLPILQIHSRKSQSYRTKVSEQFRKESNLVLFSSDVSARGVDYPNITCVIQVGVTDRESYIHRLGRTARAGAGGRGVLLLMPEEKYCRAELHDLPIEDEALPAFTPTDPDLLAMQAAIRSVVGHEELRVSAEQAFQAWLGFYNGCCRKLGWSKEQLVAKANFLATRCMGLNQPPRLPRRTVGKMNLSGTKGLLVE